MSMSNAKLCPFIVFSSVLEIRNSRTKAWDVIKTRSHKLMRVYAFDSDANDLLAIGSAVQGLANGKSISGEWVARIRFEEEQAAGGKLKIELHQVWAVCLRLSDAPPLFPLYP